MKIQHMKCNCMLLINAELHNPISLGVRADFIGMSVHETALQYSRLVHYCADRLPSHSKRELLCIIHLEIS